VRLIGHDTHTPLPTLASKSAWDLFGAHCVGLACSLRLPFGCPQPPAPGGWNVTSRRMHDAFGLKLEAKNLEKSTFLTTK
jgi:hypothetical protein